MSNLDSISNLFSQSINASSEVIFDARATAIGSPLKFNVHALRLEKKKSSPFSLHKFVFIKRKQLSFSDIELLEVEVKEDFAALERGLLTISTKHPRAPRVSCFGIVKDRVVLDRTKLSGHCCSIHAHYGIPP